MDRKWGLRNQTKLFMVRECRQFFVSDPTGSYFYASDGDEPIHVHVLRDDEMAKFWLQPVRLAVNIGFPPKELRQIEK